MGIELMEYDGPLKTTRGRSTSEETKTIINALQQSLDSGKPFVWKGGVAERKANTLKVRNVAKKHLNAFIRTGMDGDDLQFLAVRESAGTGVKPKAETAPEPVKPSPPKKA